MDAFQLGTKLAASDEFARRHTEPVPGQSGWVKLTPAYFNALHKADEAGRSDLLEQKFDWMKDKRMREVEGSRGDRETDHKLWPGSGDYAQAAMIRPGSNLATAAQPVTETGVALRSAIFGDPNEPTGEYFYKAVPGYSWRDSSVAPPEKTTPMGEAFYAGDDSPYAWENADRDPELAPDWLKHLAQKAQIRAYAEEANAKEKARVLAMTQNQPGWTTGQKAMAVAGGLGAAGLAYLAYRKWRNRAADRKLPKTP